MVAVELPERRCFLPGYTQESAAAEKQNIERGLRLRCKIAYCEIHGEYHVVYGDRRSLLDERHRKILEMVSMGLRDPEIANDLGLTIKQIEHAVTRLSRRLNAISRPNLVAIAISLGIVDPSGFLAATSKLTKGKGNRGN